MMFKVALYYLILAFVLIRYDFYIAGQIRCKILENQ